MATIVRYTQLDSHAQVTVVGHHSSHSNCLITEPVLTPSFNGGYLTMYWTAFSAIIGGVVYTIPEGSYQVDNGNLPPTTVYFIVNSSGYPQFLYNTLPSGNYALVASFRYKTSGGIIIYYVNPNNNAISDILHKSNNLWGLSRPAYLGGLLPVGVNVSNGNIFIGSTGFVRFGSEFIQVQPITSGNIIIEDNDTIVSNLYSITANDDNTPFNSDEVVGFLVGLNIGGLDVSLPYVVVRPKYNGFYYTELEEAIQDRYSKIKKGFGQNFINIALPLFVYIYKRNDTSKFAVINLMDAPYSNPYCDSRITILERGQANLSNVTSYRVTFSRNRYNYTPQIQLGFNQEFYLSNIDETGFTVNFTYSYTGLLYYYIIG